MNLRSFIPILEWLPSYRQNQLKGDLAAGLTVGVMLIPQGMAYAMIAGLPPIYGLYAATVPLLIYAILGTSRQLAVGPVAMVSILTATGVGVIAQTGTEVYIGMAILLAFLVGAIQFLLGVFRLGFLVNFLSHPVLSGFTSAAALIIGFSQLKHLLGIEIARSHHVHEILIQAVKKLAQINLYTLAIGLVGIFIILGIKRLNKGIPGSLIAVVLGILVVWGFDLEQLGVSVVGSVPSGLPSFEIPEITLENIQKLFPITLAISLVSFMESFAVAKAIRAKHKNYKVISNQELIALGLANIGGAFFQSYPTTGGFSRTAVNNQAGARTGMASIFSALLIIITLLFLTSLFYYLPNAILASVIMVAVFGLIDVREVLYLRKANRTDLWMLIATFFATLMLGIEQGIGVGVILSLAMLIFRTTRPHFAELGKVPGTHFYRNRDRFENVEVRKDVLIVRFDAQLYFANINYFKDQLEAMVDVREENLKYIIINSDSINYMDSTAIHALEELVMDYVDKNLTVLFSGVKGPVRDALYRSGIISKLGESRLHMSIQEAVDFIDRENTNEDIDYQHYTLQSNT